MDKQDFLRQQYVTLRDEIKATKQRVFLIVMLGLIAVPIVAYLAETRELSFIAPMLPFLVMVLTIMFFAEQNALMRAGHFIRSSIEPQVQGCPGWESWLESKPDLRIMDKHFAGCFLIVFVVFFLITVGMAINTLWTADAGSGRLEWRVIAGGVSYAVAAVWMVLTLLHHWKSSTTTGA